MAFAALLAGVLLWLTFGTKVIRAKKNWPPLGVMALGLVLLGIGKPLTGLLLVGGGMAWMRQPWKKLRTPAKPFAQDLALAEARDLLGLPADADREAIVAAHRRLITRNHPDSGGTEALAARLNAARDLLLKAERN